MNTPPLTHAQYARDIAQAAKARRPLRQRVQVSYGGAVVCGIILDAWDTPDGHEMWKVELTGVVRGTLSFPTSLVRKCSGVDGRCTCVKEKP